jgi:hypothetical protein
MQDTKVVEQIVGPRENKSDVKHQCSCACDSEHREMKIRLLGGGYSRCDARRPRFTQRRHLLKLRTNLLKVHKGVMRVADFPEGVLEEFLQKVKASIAGAEILTLDDIRKDLSECLSNKKYVVSPKGKKARKEARKRAAQKKLLEFGEEKQVEQEPQKDKE